MAAVADRSESDPVWQSEGRGRTVLVVDPDRTARTVLVLALRPAGYRVIEAERADKALFLALERPVSAFLVAQDLPGFPLAEFCARVRTMSCYREAPIFALLMPFDETAVNTAFAAGVDDFLTRPVLAEQLRIRLSGRLRRTSPGQDTSPVELAAKGVEAGPLLRPDDGRVPGRSAPRICALAMRFLAGPAGAATPTGATRLAGQVDCIYRHGGFVARLTGEGLCAVFAGPDPVARAVACARELQEGVYAGRAVAELPVGIGLHEGPPGSGPPSPLAGGASPSVEDTLATAEKLSAEAAPMEILVSEAVAAAAGRLAGQLREQGWRVERGSGLIAGRGHRGSTSRPRAA